MNELPVEKYASLKILEKRRWNDSKNMESIEIEMMSILDNLLGENPDDVISLTNLGALQSDMGNHDKALKTLRLSERLNFNDSNLYKNIGIVMINLADYRHLAKSYFEKSRELPKNEFTFVAYFDPIGH